ncbi:unnamed protein product [Pedinophyceae sp. YPF-701]|nr:unnamed protein product [Pedinophyceae sp. YPF-701]
MDTPLRERAQAVVERLQPKANSRRRSGAQTPAEPASPVDENALIELKNIARTNPQEAQVCYALLMDALGRRSVGMRRAALFALSELVRRSRSVRALAAERMTDIVRVAVTETSTLLVGPEAARRQLRAEGVAAVLAWAERHGEQHREFVIAARHLRAKGEDVARPDPEQQRARQFEEARRGRLRRELDNAVMIAETFEDRTAAAEARAAALWDAARALAPPPPPAQHEGAGSRGQSPASSGSSSDEDEPRASRRDAPSRDAGGACGAAHLAAALRAVPEARVRELRRDVRILAASLEDQLIAQTESWLGLVQRLGSEWLQGEGARQQLDLGERALDWKLRLLATRESVGELRDALGDALEAEGLRGREARPEVAAGLQSPERAVEVVDGLEFEDA